MLNSDRLRASQEVTQGPKWKGNKEEKHTKVVTQCGCASWKHSSIVSPPGAGCVHFMFWCVQTVAMSGLVTTTREWFLTAPKHPPAPISLTLAIPRGSTTSQTLCLRPCISKKTPKPGPLGRLAGHRPLSCCGDAAGKTAFAGWQLGPRRGASGHRAGRRGKASRDGAHSTRSYSGTDGAHRRGHGSANGADRVRGDVRDTNRRPGLAGREFDARWQRDAVRRNPSGDE